MVELIYLKFIYMGFKLNVVVGLNVLNNLRISTIILCRINSKIHETIRLFVTLYAKSTKKETTKVG